MSFQWRTIWQYLSKLQTLWPFDLAVPLLGMYSTDLFQTCKRTSAFYCSKLKKVKKRKKEGGRLGERTTKDSNVYQWGVGQINYIPHLLMEYYILYYKQRVRWFRICCYRETSKIHFKRKEARCMIVYNMLILLYKKVSISIFSFAIICVDSAKTHKKLIRWSTGVRVEFSSVYFVYIVWFLNHVNVLYLKWNTNGS